MHLTAEPDWLYCVPWGLRKMLVWLKQTYNDPEIIITENGFSVNGEDKLKGEAALRHKERVVYLQGYVNQALQAVVQDGVKLRGYFHWSLMDNFEWADGYHCRFGLYHVEFEQSDRKRIAKDSAMAYREIVSNNGFL